MTTIFPKKQKLKKGDCIGILSCASAIVDTDKLENAKKYFENLGFNVKISTNAYEPQNEYLSGSDDIRAEVLNRFFADDSIDAIIAARGGYGSIRILDKIDYNLIKSNPKIFAGYSDITALSLMIYKKTGLVSYNSPMAIPDFGNETNTFTENSFKKFFIEDKVVTEIEIQQKTTYKSGYAHGLLWGGNLSTIQSLCGTDFIPDEKIIFVTEDINEPVYKIDKMFTQLLNIDNFKKNLSAIIFGDFTQIDDKKLLDSLFHELAEELNIPVVSGLKFGHEKEKICFPIGIQCSFNTNDNYIQIINNLSD